MRIISKLNGFFRTFEYRPPRVHARLPVWLQFQSPEKSLVPAVCVDISENGMGADLEQAFEVGTRATLVIPSAYRPEPYIIPVRVVSRQEQRHGFVFRPARVEDVHEIAAAVREVARGSVLSHDSESGLLAQAERKAV